MQGRRRRRVNGPTTPFEQTLELELDGHGRYLIVGSRGGPAGARRSGARRQAPVRHELRRRAVAGRRGRGRDRLPTGCVPVPDRRNRPGGDDGRRRLLARLRPRRLDGPVRRQLLLRARPSAWERRGGLPRSSLFHNVHGRFTDVSKASGADVALRGTGCVAADFNGDGRTDLYVTAASGGALLWNDGQGRFSEGAAAAGLPPYQWHAGAAVSDVNGDGRPDLFIAGYANPESPLQNATGGSRARQAVRDLLYLNDGPDRAGHSRFREVGATGAVSSGDGRLRARRGVHGCERRRPSRPLRRERHQPQSPLRERARRRGREGRPNRSRLPLRRQRAGARRRGPGAGMGIAIADYSLDGRSDVIVTNSHRQLHAAYRSTGAANQESGFRDARLDFVSAFDTSLAGWGVSWVDLDNDGNLDLAIANGAIPVTAPKRDAERIQVLENLAAQVARASSPMPGRSSGSAPSDGSGAVSRPPTTTTTAGSTSPSTRSAASSSCSTTRARMGIGSRSRRARSPPAR